MEDAKRTKRVREEDERMSLEEHIVRKREAFLRDRDEAPAMRASAAELRKRASAMTRRWQIRLRRDLLRQAGVLEEEAGVRESMVREHEFERTVVSYLRMYHRPPAAPASCTRSESVEVFVKNSDETAQRRRRIMDEYLTDVDRAPAKVAMNARDECPRCSHGPKLLLDAARSIMTCPECGYSLAYLDATTSSTAFDEVVEFSQYSYKRVNHYTMHLALVQGKETHRVPDETLQTVMADLYDRVGVRDVDDITPRRVRESLRRLRLRKAYDHVTQIVTRLTGRRPPRITPEMEDRLKNLFLKMQPAFQRHAPKTRTNFLSYSYVLYRSFQLLGLDNMLDSISLLKGRDKLEANDAIFRKMAEDHGWEVPPLPPPCDT